MRDRPHSCLVIDLFFAYSFGLYLTCTISQRFSYKKCITEQLTESSCVIRTSRSLGLQSLQQLSRVVLLNQKHRANPSSRELCRPLDLYVVHLVVKLDELSDVQGLWAPLWRLTCFALWQHRLEKGSFMQNQLNR